MSLHKDDNRKKPRFSLLEPATGRILVSEPFMPDLHFYRSVVVLADHSHEGTFGLVLNRPVKLRFNEVLKGFPRFDGHLYLGGPVKTSSLYFIHTLGHRLEGSLKIMEGLYWGGNVGALKEMIATRQAGSAEVRFFMGYSGWVSGQLDRELDERSWVVANSNAASLLETRDEDLWLNAVRNLGGRLATWANYPPDPIMN